MRHISNPLILLLAFSFLPVTTGTKTAGPDPQNSTPSAQASTFVVNTRGIGGDDTMPGDGTCQSSGYSDGFCTLRAAIQEANATSGRAIIEFSVSGRTPSGQIDPLPTIDNEVLIDGYSAPGYNNGAPEPEAPAPQIILNGENVSSGVSGLSFSENAGGSTVRGLAIINFTDEGLEVGGNAILIQGCYVGLRPNGTTAAGNSTDPTGTGAAITLESTANSATLGEQLVAGSFEGRSNVISGNNGHGILIAGGNNHHVQSNLIGTGADGLATVGNDGFGIIVKDGDFISIGGLSFGDNAGNTISANDNGGVKLDGGNVDVFANYIGTDVSGSTVGGGSLGNGGPGVLVGSGTHRVGTTDALTRNVISGNVLGVRLGGGGAVSNNNKIAGNYIGVDKNAVSALPNNHAGVRIDDGSNNLIHGNVVSGNGNHGINLRSSFNTVTGNHVGTTPAGDDLANGGLGIRIGTPGNVVGASTADSANVVGLQPKDGIRVLSNHNRVQNNYIGTNASSDDLGNGGDGIQVAGSDNNVVNNVIGYNDRSGIYQNSGSRNNYRNNFIGADESGGDIGNADFGVLIGSGSSENDIFGNTLAFNDVGASVRGGSTQNSILQNQIFSNDGLGIELGTDGTTANDAEDADTGSNNLQNFPEIQSAGYDAGTNEVTVRYFVPSDPSLTGSGASTYDLRVDFYRSDAANQEGAAHLGTDTYSSSDYSGCPSPPCPVTTTMTPAGSVDESDHVVATVTDANGNTSEFSATARKLPVELASFEATPSGRESVRLTWSTASETNNARFVVQRALGRSADQAASGRHGDREPMWHSVGSVEGAGMSQHPQSYALTDEDLPFGAEHLTYRLVQYDLNGAREVVSDRTVELPSAQTTKLMAPVPNPVRHRLTLRYVVAKKQPVVIALYDALGRKLETVVEASQKGRQQVRVRARPLSAGVYFVRMTTIEGTRTRRFTVIH